VKENQEDTTLNSDKEGPKYILVGGSFKDESNAEKYLEQLKAEGYEPFHLGKRGSFYIIGIGKYNTFEEADEAKEIYTKKNPGSGVWVKKE
jgi:cell division septation protein DedD